MAKLTPAAAALTDLVLDVFRLNGLVIEAGDRLAKPSGLTSARWQVLGVVDHEPTPVSHVARTMGLTRQSVQQVADALARDGFVEYLDNPHHRTAKLIALTPRGREVLRQVEARHAAWANRLGKQLDLADLRAAVDGLRKVQRLLEEDTEPPPARPARKG